jgi:outer membrane protein OmpA-like peptidoglycan-associated protein
MRAFLLVLVAGTATVAGLLTPGAALAVTCSSSGVTVAPLHGTRFYTDSGSSLSSGYTGVSVASSTARANVWVGVSAFTGGVLGLNANQPAAIPLGDVAANTSVPAYFFMTASPMTDSAVAQNFTVTLYQGDPAHGGTTLCSYADGYSKGVYDTIKAAANKVQDVTGDSIAASVSTSSPVIGGTITLTVEGTTGTLGSGPDGTPFIYETPTTLPSWPAGAFRLVGTTLTLSPGTASAVTYTNQLEISDASWSAAKDYIAKYTFRITGTTSTSTSAYPIQEISSGTQVKHTDPGSFAASIPAIPPATNPLTLTQTASTATLPASGGTVDYTLTLASSSTTSSTVDQLLDTMPAGASYVAGSAKLNGSAAVDPTASGSTLVFPGPFAVTSSSSAVVTYTLTLPGTTGSYVNSAVGYVASTTIDTTTSTSDSSPATATVAVGAPPPQAQTITFPQPADTRVDQGPVTLGATASSGLTVAYTSSTTSVCTVAGSSVTLLTTGTCTITAAQSGNVNYAAAASSSRSFAVTAAPQAQSISFPQPPDTREDLGPVALTATASSGLGVSYTSSTSSVCAVSGSRVTLLTTGTCTVTAHQAGNGSYSAAADVGRSFAIAAAPVTLLSQSITFGQPADTRQDQGPVTLAGAATSGLTITYVSSTPVVCTVSGSAVTLLGTGTCTITADQAGDTSYSAAGSVSRSFQVTAAPGAPQAQTVTFPQPADTRVDQGPVTLGASASSGLAVTYATATPSVCTVSGSTVTLLVTGSCTITADQPGDGSYAAAPTVTRSLQVTAAPVTPLAPQPQAITFPQPADTREDQGPVTLGASASSGLPVTYTSATTSVCTITGSSATLVATGTCMITAEQGGNGSFDPASPEGRSFEVTAAPGAPSGPQAQTLLFPQPADTDVGAGGVTLTGSTTSGLTVSYSSSTPAVCTVSGAAVTLLTPGTCTITAGQAGNATYGAAASVGRSFQVTAAPGAPAQTQTVTVPVPSVTPAAPAAPAPPPMTVPTAVPAHTTSGKPGSTVLAGLPATASVVLAPSPAIPGVAGVTIVGFRVAVTPTKAFSGIATIPILIQDGDRTVETTVSIVVRPAPATHVLVTPVSATATRIAWQASASAQGYVVEVDGRVVCRTNGTNCRLPSLVGPGATVVVTALGNAGTRSVQSAGRKSAGRPVLLSVVHFASGSAALDHVATRILDATRATVRRYGFAHATLKCNTDNAGALGYNVALSRSRCVAVSRYLIRATRAGSVAYRQKAYAYLRPFVPNTSRARMAANRRVEIWVK